MRKNPSLIRLGLLLFLTSLGDTHTGWAQGTAFTYQGRLDQNGAAYSGPAEFQATLWSASSNGTSLATNSPLQVVVAVTNGLFVLPLDFGASFPGADRWLQLEVRTALGPFTTLVPRQKLTPTPYAIQALNAATATTLASPLSEALLSTNVARVNATNVFSVPQKLSSTPELTYTFSPTATGLILTESTTNSSTQVLVIDATTGDSRFGRAFGGYVQNRGDGSITINGAVTLESANLNGNFSANNATCVFFCNTTSGNITITLPSPTGLTGRFYIIKKTSANNTLTISPTSGTIEGAASIALTANYSYRIVMSNGSNWYIIGQNL